MANIFSKDVIFTKNTPYFLLLWLLAIMFIVAGMVIYQGGEIAADTMDQYMQVIGAIPVHDWHPPLVTRIWQFGRYLTKSDNIFVPFLAFSLPVGLALILSLRPSLFSICIFTLLLVSPLFFPQIGMMTKDSIFAACILLYCALSLWGLKREGKIEEGDLRKIGIVWLFFISFIRINSVFLTAPLIVSNFFPKLKKISLYFLSLPVVLLLLAFSGFLNHTILGAKNAHPERSLEIFDLAGIARYSEPKVSAIRLTFSPIDGRNPVINADNGGKWEKADWDSYTVNQKLNVCYTPLMWDVFYSPSSWGIYGPGLPGKMFDFLPPAIRELCGPVAASLGADSKDLKKKWVSALMHHPIAYLDHRFHFYKEGFLGNILGNPPISYWDAAPGYYYFDGNFVVSKNSEGWAFFNKITQNTQKPLLYGSTWFAVTLFLYLVTFKSKESFLGLANIWAFSGLMYMLGYFFCGVGSEYRYLLPSVYLDVAIVLGMYVTRQYPKIKRQGLFFSVFTSLGFLLMTIL